MEPTITISYLGPGQGGSNVLLRIANNKKKETFILDYDVVERDLRITRFGEDEEATWFFRADNLAGMEEYEELTKMVSVAYDLVTIGLNFPIQSIFDSPEFKRRS